MLRLAVALDWTIHCRAPIGIAILHTLYSSICFGSAIRFDSIHECAMSNLWTVPQPRSQAQGGVLVVPFALCSSVL